MASVPISSPSDDRDAEIHTGTGRLAVTGYSPTVTATSSAAPAVGGVIVTGHSPTVEALNRISDRLEHMLLSQPDEWRARWGPGLEADIKALRLAGAPRTKRDQALKVLDQLKAERRNVAKIPVVEIANKAKVSLRTAERALEEWLKRNA